MRRALLVLAVLVAAGCDPLPWPDDPSSSPAATDDPPSPPPPAADSPLELREGEAAALDPRASSAHPRARALLVTEVEGLQTLFGATPNSAPDRLDVLRRLAEDYVELARSAELEPPTPADPREAATVARAMRVIASTARTAAIAAYTALLATSYPARDEVHYYRALEYARAGRVDEAKADASAITNAGDGRWAARARLLRGIELAGDPAERAHADEAFAEAARSPDAAVAQAARARLSRAESALAEVAHATREPIASVSRVRAPPPPPPPAVTCALDMECRSAEVCRGGVCVTP